MLRASIVIIGDEILGGFVRDTNSGWLAERLHALGVPLDRVVTVPDQTAAIDEALATELRRVRPRIVLTSGGVGSTPDDLTLAAVAASLGLKLAVDPEIDVLVTRALRWTEAQGGRVTPEHERAMRKMSKIPEGARVLASKGGFAPGIAVDIDGGCHDDVGVTIAVLPGVPSELMRIMRQGIEPTLLAGRGAPMHVVEICHSYPESTLTPLLDRLVAEFPDVHLGSYPNRECTVRLKGSPERVDQAAALIREFLGGLDRTPGSSRLRAAWQSHWS